MQNTFKKIKVYLILIIFFPSISGCGKNQNDSKNLKPNISFTKFQFAVTAPEKNAPDIGNWKVDTQLKCPSIIVENRDYSIDKVFTKNGKETIDFPSAEYDCTLTIKSFELSNTRYNPKNKNSPYILTKQNRPSANFENYVNVSNTEQKFISGKINNDNFSFHIFEIKENAALFNHIELLFTPIDEVYSKLEIQNLSMPQNNIDISVDINKIDSSNLIDESISIHPRTNENNDSKYGDSYRCSDITHNPHQKVIKNLSNGSRCALVFKTTNNNFGVHTANMSIEISNIKYHLSITNKLYLYLTGHFTSPCLHVAQWDGNEFKCMSTGLLLPGHALFQTPNGNLYAGREFNERDKTAVTMWNGDNWKEIRSQTNHDQPKSGKIRTLAVNDKETLIFAGGQFKKFDYLDPNANNLVLFQNGNWRRIGSPNGEVHSISFSPDFSKLYIGGSFNRILIIPGFRGGFDSASIASIDNVNEFKDNENISPNWSTVGGGLNGQDVHAILPLPDNQSIYVAGGFRNLIDPTLLDRASADISQFAVWNNSRWSEQNNDALNRGHRGRILTMKKSVDGNDLYIGGHEEQTFFNFFGSFTFNTNKFARWNNGNWAMPNETFPDNSSTKAIAISPNGKTVYIAGNYVGVPTPTECNYIMGYNVGETNMTRYCLPSESHSPFNGDINALELKNSWSAAINESTTVLTPVTTVFKSK
jgi:hypothetical protein